MATLRTVTIRASGGDYTSLQAAITAEAKDLVALDRVLRFDCGNLQDTTAAYVNGFITDATRYVEIVATARHDGRWSTSAYRIVGNFGYDVGCLRINNNQRVIVDGVQVENTRGVGNRPVGIQVEGTGTQRVTIRNPIVRYKQAGTETERDAGGIKLFFTSGCTVDLENPLVYGWGSNIVSFGYNVAATINAYNITAVNGQVENVDFSGLDTTGGATLRLRNALVQGTGPANIRALAGGAGLSTSTNLTEDASSPNAALRNKVVAFVDEAGDDFRLAAGDTEARNTGTNLSADASYPFATDLIGTARPQGAAWDIGAHEYLAAGTTHDVVITDSVGFAESMTWTDESDFPDDAFGFSEAYAFSVQSPAVSDLVLTEAFGMSDAYTFSVTSPTPPAGELSARRGKGAVLRRRRR